MRGIKSYRRFAMTRLGRVVKRCLRSFSPSAAAPHVRNELPTQSVSSGYAADSCTVAGGSLGSPCSEMPAPILPATFVQMGFTGIE